MRFLFFAITTLVTCVPVVVSADIKLPPVKDSYRYMHPGDVKGKTLREIVPPEGVKLIALARRGSSADWDASQMIQRAFMLDAQG